jgi:hypothetical protein
MAKRNKKKEEENEAESENQNDDATQHNTTQQRPTSDICIDFRCAIGSNQLALTVQSNH